MSETAIVINPVELKSDLTALSAAISVIAKYLPPAAATKVNTYNTFVMNIATNDMVLMVLVTLLTKLQSAGTKTSFDDLKQTIVTALLSGI